MNLIVFFLVLGLGWVLKVRFLWKPTGKTHKAFPTPVFLGHRGALHREPENTLPSYQAALNAGMDGVEIDVIATRDGEVVCSHNFDLERETDGFGFIDELTFADLGPVRTGLSRPQLTPTGLYSLLEVTDRLPETALLNIEIKSWRGFDLKTGLLVARMIKAGKIRQPVIVSSFNPLVITAVKWVDPSISTGLILETMDWFWTLNWFHPDALHPTAELVDKAFIRYARDRRLKVNVWTVNTRPAIDALLDMGVDGIITDYPELCPLREPLS
jgi:glycerophosphoryl diester phosphodiesterase